MTKSFTMRGLAYLRRLHDKLGASVTWEVLTEDKKIRVGIIERRNSAWLEKRVGWQKFPIKYWLGHKFYGPQVYIGNTRSEVVSKIMRKYYGKE